jgi:uncharacterized Zn-binding protein involved in type VI secretion
VQVISAVGAMQAAGHDKPHGTGSIVPALAKNARTGHPLFRNGKRKPRNPGHPSKGWASPLHKEIVRGGPPAPLTGSAMLAMYP